MPTTFDIHSILPLLHFEKVLIHLRLVLAWAKDQLVRVLLPVEELDEVQEAGLDRVVAQQVVHVGLGAQLVARAALVALERLTLVEEVVRASQVLVTALVAMEAWASRGQAVEQRLILTSLYVPKNTT